MGKQQLIERMITNKQEVCYTDLKKGLVEVKKETTDLLATLLLWIDDRTGLTPVNIWETLKETHINFDVVFIDYLQLVRPATMKRQRYEELDRITENIREIAKQMNIAMVVSAQLNRGVDNRENHEPRLSDLRETGGIEQTCDKIILLHRPAYYNIYEQSNKDAVDDGEAYLILAKNRNGPTGRIPCVWLGGQMSFKSPNFKLESEF
jgi:replicative DNA helicase